MTDRPINSHKIINDPVFGFIQINHNLIFRLIEHPVFQRLKRIRQLGLSSNVYPGAQHTRFQHALGAMHLTQEAVNVLRSKGQDITEKEEEAVLAAILLHDIGHGPFSHVLEDTIVHINHEAISLVLMEMLNKELDRKLDLAIKIFKGNYPKRFLHQLVSGQLDMDRMDYLRRDSFYTGVTEGTIGSARIIKMLNVVNDQLVLEAKGIYSIEKFLIARRLMYWQVYLHKTALASEKMLINVLKRARELHKQGKTLYLTPALEYFFINKVSVEGLESDRNALNQFIKLDDTDILTCLKYWIDNKDMILSTLSNGLINRKLYKIEISNTPFKETYILKKKHEILRRHNLKNYELEYFVFQGTTSSELYTPDVDKIKILYKNGDVVSVDEASEIIRISQHITSEEKFFFCYIRN
ncbi:HD domain-containing protein [Saccharicrinis sp. FJH62]|uniref:HD domain-containing protein n=1 Tax=Saccharicrinis sp. FJH62 TaxID=3344657 RepID=UPI0035D46BFA